MSLKARDRAHLRNALIEATIRCSERCLYQSAKWAAELLEALNRTAQKNRDKEGDEYFESSDAIPSVILAQNKDLEEASLETQEMSKYLLAKAFFDCREFDRCAAVFLNDQMYEGLTEKKPTNNPSSETGSTTPGTPSTPRAVGEQKQTDPITKISQRSLFLALYAKFLVGEKRQNEETEMVMGSKDLGTVTNKNLFMIARCLERWFSDERANARSQGWLEYLYGMVLARDKNEEKAISYLISSVQLFPMNWGCWLELTNLVTGPDRLEEISNLLPRNIMAYMFHTHASLELSQHSQIMMENIEQLLQIFDGSAFLMTCQALLSYHSKDFYQGEHTFSRLLALHPHRLDGLDHYSNILYVLGMRPKLVFLAHLCSNVDRFRPESCVVIGNYYSLISVHTEAVAWFRRALTLDRNCLSAWTLMGHEYVELKNTHAAIESYRRAVELNRRDHRAWYGLGQAYEMLEMHAYSLWYYKRACGLRPWDGKMWMAIGTSLQYQRHYAEAINALKRALMADAYFDPTSTTTDPSHPRGIPTQMDPDILLQIALNYVSLGQFADAKAYMELCIAQEVGGAAAAAAAAATAVSTTTNASQSTTSRLNDTLMSEDSLLLAPTSTSTPRSPPSQQVVAPPTSAPPAASEGTGVTVSTSRARMWLARHALETGDYATAAQLGTELCDDGFDIEEAKAIVREARSCLDNPTSMHKRR